MRSGTALNFRFLVAFALAFGIQSGSAIAADPGKPPKACAAARNRIAQQQKAIADIDGRIAKEQQGRANCASGKNCHKFDRTIEALDRRKTEFENKVQRYREVEAKACATGAGSVGTAAPR